MKYDNMSDEVKTNDSNKSNKEAINEITTKSLQVILPTFIQNEQKHSNSTKSFFRNNRIQSSPIKKSQRRFSQDSDTVSANTTGVNVKLN